VSDLNQCTFTGRVVSDPRTGTFQSGDEYANFSIANNRRIKNADGEWVDRKPATFLDIKATGRLATRIKDRLHKGTPVFIVGRMEMREYTDRDNQARKVLEVIADRIEVISLPQRAEGSGSYNGGNSGRTEAPAPRQAPVLPEPSFDDDPF